MSPTVTHRAAITDPVALGGLLRAIEGFDGQPSTKTALRLAESGRGKGHQGHGTPRKSQFFSDVRGKRKISLPFSGPMAKVIV